MRSSWTGGQYSLFRFGLGLALFALVGGPAQWSLSFLPGFFPALFFGACALALAIGFLDRAAAILLMVALSGRVHDESIAFFAILLLLHALIPRSPYGAWSARGRTDPRGGWSRSARLSFVLWIAVSADLLYWGVVSRAWYHLAAACLIPLFFIAQTRPYAWLALLGLLPFDFRAGLLWALFFLFEPGWLPPRRGEAPIRIYYDGVCALCHGALRFLLAESPRSHPFRFAPLQGSTFATQVPAEKRAALPDTVVVQPPDGRLLVRSAATAYLLEELGGFWRIGGVLLRSLPRRVGDFLYEALTRHRYALFGKKQEVCPLLPPDLKQYFLN